MDEKTPTLWEKVTKLMGEKGFYIILFLCVAVIGVSGWMILSSLNGLEEADSEPLSVTVSVPAPAERETAVTPPAVTEWPASLPETNTPAVATLRPEPPEHTEPSVPPVEREPEPEKEPETMEPPAEQSLSVPDPVPEPPEETHEVLAPQPEPVPEPTPEPLPAALVWPLSGPVETPHSLDALVYNRTMADWRTHNGLDVAATLGARVMAVADGQVEQIYSDTLLGTTVVILHSGGLRSIYANLAELPAVRIGDTVGVGDVIGAVGETALGEIGDVTHLHFAMSVDGAPVDPRDILPAR